MKIRIITLLVLSTLTNTIIAHANSDSAQPINVSISTLEFNEQTLVKSLSNKSSLTLNKTFNESLSLSKTTGLSACVYLPDEGLWSNAFGVEDSIDNSSITTSSKFHAGSIGKLITATLILGLIEKKKFTLNTKIKRWFKGVKHANNISVEHLLNHTSGLPVHFIDHPSDLTFQSKVNRALNGKLAFTPGSGFTYSNPGYIILGMILEQEYQQSLPQVIQTHFIQTLNLNESDVVTNNNKDTVLVNSKNDYDYSSVGGAGILASTPCDLIRTLNSLLTHRVVNNKTLSEMNKVAYPMNYEGTLYWTRGLMFLETPLGRVHFLNGKIGDFAASVFYHPKLKAFISVMTNDQATTAYVGPIIFHFLKTIDKEIKQSE